MGVDFKHNSKRVFHIAHLKGFSLAVFLIGILCLPHGKLFQLPVPDISLYAEMEKSGVERLKAGAFKSVGKEKTFRFRSMLIRCNFRILQFSQKRHTHLSNCGFFFFYCLHKMSSHYLNRIYGIFNIWHQS
jgi:hypothetical protein